MVLGTDSDFARGFINGVPSPASAVPSSPAAGIALLMGSVRRSDGWACLLSTLAVGIVGGLLGLGPLHAYLPEQLLLHLGLLDLAGYGLLLTRLAAGHKTDCVRRAAPPAPCS